MSGTSYERPIIAFANESISVEGISKIILLADRLIILLQPNLFGKQNVRCYTLLGSIIWTIPSPISLHPESETYFVGLTLREKKLLVYSKDGLEYDVSLETGQFNSYELVK